MIDEVSRGMWERKYEQGRWNGLELNILTTSLDGGKRLQVSDIPYAELPLIKVMGSKANNIDLEVIFVGVNSLVDSNALINSLSKTPKGELEHPWLGELPLVFDTYSQQITTKRGVVTLSLTFVRDGKKPVLIRTITTTTNTTLQQASEVDNVSSKTFIQDVESMDISEISSLQQDFTQCVNALVGIASQLSVPSQMLSALNQELNSAFMAISSIANAPGQFAEQLSKTIDSIASAVRSEPNSKNEAVDNSRTAQKTMLSAINPSTPTAHYNVQMVTAAVKMSKDIAVLEQDDAFDIAATVSEPSSTTEITSNKQALTIMSDLATLSKEVASRVDEVTDGSTLESIELYHSLIALKEGIDNQYNKVKKGSEPQSYVDQVRPLPALVLAHQSDSNEKMVTALNPSMHPLFLHGTVAMRVSE